MSIKKYSRFYYCRCEYCGKEICNKDKQTLSNVLTSLGWHVGGHKASYCNKCWSVVSSKKKNEIYKRRWRKN